MGIARDAIRLRVQSELTKQEHMKNQLITTAILTALTATVAYGQSDDWKARAVSPVTNPLFFEDPHIRTEARPIFAYHHIGADLLDSLGLKGVGGGDVRVYAMQLRYAVTDRLAIIATKDGYTDIHFDHLPSLSKSGWNDLAAGLKYALIQDAEKDEILTAGVKIELPTGNERVFQGNGSGEWDLFLSGAKGYKNFRALGSVGWRIPNNFDDESSIAHYSLQFEYRTCKWFIPFVAANGITVVAAGNQSTLADTGVGIDGWKVEGFDLLNFGANNSDGFTQIVGGVGFRSQLCSWADLGFAYEKSLTTPKALFDDRFTVDFVIRF
jgi:hypothetical protein